MAFMCVKSGPWAEVPAPAGAGYQATVHLEGGQQALACWHSHRAYGINHTSAGEV
jgi:hypothetical protein